MSSRIVVKRKNWRFHDNDEYEPGIRIDDGERFIMISVAEGRRIVDRVHDICDRIEARQREEQQ